MLIHSLFCLNRIESIAYSPFFLLLSPGLIVVHTFRILLVVALAYAFHQMQENGSRLKS